MKKHKLRNLGDDEMRTQLREMDDQLFRVIPNVSPKLLFHRDPKLHHPAGGL